MRVKTFDLLVVGELNPDLILQGSDLQPTFGQVEQLVDCLDLTIGSSAAIFACGAARLGLRVAFIGKTGPDLFGSFMRQELAARGIDTSGIVIDPTVSTGLSVILSRTLDRAILTYSGAIGALHFNEIDFSLMERARHLHLASYFLLRDLRPDIPQLFRRAKGLGLSTSLDTNYDPSEQWDAGLDETLRHVDIFLPNEKEACAITHQSDPELALAALAERIPTVAVKLGPRGGAACQAGRTVHTPALLVKVVDTTGAGDTFDAGFIFGSLSGFDLERTLKLACACGSLSTRAAGGTTAQPTLDEALRLRE